MPANMRTCFAKPKNNICLLRSQVSRYCLLVLRGRIARPIYINEKYYKVVSCCRCVTNYTDKSPPVCTGDSLALITSNEYCGYILDKTEGSPFHLCLIGEDYLIMGFEDCVHDVCAVFPDSDEMKKAACHSLTVTMNMCNSEGSQVRADWRQMTNCSESNRFSHWAPIVLPALTNLISIAYTLVLAI